MLQRQTITDDIRRLLSELQAQYKLAVVSSSNSSEVVPILMKEQILSIFNTVVCGDHVQRLKPAPDPYLLAAERLGVGRVLVVEDSEAGAASGLAAGFDVLRVSDQSEVVPELRKRLGLI